MICQHLSILFKPSSVEEAGAAYGANCLFAGLLPRRYSSKLSELPESLNCHWSQVHYKYTTITLHDFQRCHIAVVYTRQLAAPGLDVTWLAGRLHTTICFKRRILDVSVLPPASSQDKPQKKEMMNYHWRKQGFTIAKWTSTRNKVCKLFVRACTSSNLWLVMLWVSVTNDLSLRAEFAAYPYYTSLYLSFRLPSLLPLQLSF